MSVIRVKSAFILRRDTAANWNTKNPILREGEEGYETDTGKRKVGDGTTEWNNLKYDSGIVDQTYTPTSANAQSGKAVAEAVATEQNRADNTFSNALKGTISDTAMLIDDVSPVTHEMGVKVKSKNLLIYPYVETTLTRNGITFTDNGDGTITANGTATADTQFRLQDTGVYPDNYNPFVNLINQRVTITGSPDGSSKDTYGIQNIYTGSFGNGSLTITNRNYYRYAILIKSGITVENLVFKPQIELGTTATAYTPYVPDLTAVKVTRCGKNLLDIQNPLSTAKDPIITYNSITATKDLAYATYQVFLVAGDYTISLIKSSYASLTITDSSGNVIYNVGSPSNVNYTFSLLTNDTLKFKIGFGRFVESGITSITVSNVQLELSSTATYYEPYITPTDYTPTADGTVNGVTSLYPNTTLMTDTDGVIIDCEYNRDINKAFAELQQAIISSGGNV